MIQTIIRQYDFNFEYANKLVEDLNETQMTTTPCKGLENHPSFTLGHLLSAKVMLINGLGGNAVMPEGWDILFTRKGPGDPTLPSKHLQSYPPKEKILQELERNHDEAKELLLKLSPSKYHEIDDNWRFGKYFPDFIDTIVFMCINHEAMHLSQLSAWRRAMGLPSALALM